MGKNSNNLNGLNLPRFKVSKRPVRKMEIRTLLSERYKEKMRDEGKASGV